MAIIIRLLMLHFFVHFLKIIFQVCNRIIMMLINTQQKPVYDVSKTLKCQLNVSIFHTWYILLAVMHHNLSWSIVYLDLVTTYYLTTYQVNKILRQIQVIILVGIPQKYTTIYYLWLLLVIWTNNMSNFDQHDVNGIKRRLQMTEKTLQQLEGIEFSTRWSLFDKCNLVNMSGAALVNTLIVNLCLCFWKVALSLRKVGHYSQANQWSKRQMTSLTW